MTNITFEPNDERALAFIDTQDIIKHLENLGYQVIDKSEHGDVLGKIKLIKKHLDDTYNPDFSYTDSKAYKEDTAGYSWDAGENNQQKIILDIINDNKG